MTHTQWLLLTATFCLVVPFADSQTANILSHSEIAVNPPDTVHFEKSIGNFTSTGYPSYFLGTSSNSYIFDTNTGKSCSLGVPGYYYERSKPFTWGTDKYAGVIASLENSTAWLESPVNGGGSFCSGWHVQEINPNRGAHELHVLDLDGDGKKDVVASGQQIPSNHLTAWMAFQNNYNSWPIGGFAVPSGDSLDVVAINGVNGGLRTNVVTCNPSNNSLYWYQNPGGSAARTANWKAHLIASTSTGGHPACTTGVSLASLNVGNRDIVVIASNEGGSTGSELWLPGLGYYDPGSNPNGTWAFHQIDGSFRDVHQIATDVLNGVPFFTAGEQEQSSLMCNREGYNTHKNLYDGCRVAIFAWNGGGFNAPTIASNLGTHNQTLYQLNGVEYMAGSNHDEYDAVDRAYNLWTFNFSSGGGGGGGFTAGAYNIGSSYVIDGGFYSAYWGFPPAAEAYVKNGSPVGTNPSQEFEFAASGSDFTICDVANGACLTDGGSVVDIGQGRDSWLVTASGSKWTVKNTRTGMYMGGVPSVSRGNIPMSPSPVALTLSVP